MTKRVVSNEEVVRALREMALFLEMDEVPFKPAAYERAAEAVAGFAGSLASAEKGAIGKIPGVGKGIAERIEGMLATGAMADLDALRAKTPIDVFAMTSLSGVGAKKAKALHAALGVRTVAELKVAAEAGRVRDVPRFGLKAEEKILKAIQYYEQAHGRVPIGKALEVAEQLEAAMRAVPGVRSAQFAGSLRRRKDTIGDIDIIVASDDAKSVSAAFESFELAREVIAAGDTKTSVRLSNGMQADLRVVKPEQLGAALLYFTGSKDHNVALRKIAIALDLKLNEYGVFRGDESIAGRTEEDCYAALGLAWVPPEMREDHGEIELARKRALPALLEVGMIRGDLQMHTTWSDGKESIAAMALAAQALGRDYIAITDHAKGLAITQGLDAAALIEQAKEIREAERTTGMRVLHGVEVNIGHDGSLDLPDDALERLDFVGAAMHSYFDQPRDVMTKRMIRAIEHPHVDVVFHPTTRQIGKRRGIDVDFDAVIEACVRTGTVLEIDAHPHRLDLPDEMVKRAIDAGVRIAIDSDAHSPAELRYVDRFGIGAARRGWVEPRHVVNTMPVEELLATLKGARMRRASVQ